MHFLPLSIFFMFLCPLVAQAQPDSLKTSSDSLQKKWLDAFVPSGQISAGYTHGLLPYMVNDSVQVSSYFQTEGTIDLQAGKLPLDVSFFYTSLKNITGLNNYFRISFDAQRYKQQLLQKVYSKKDVFTGKLDSLYKIRQTGYQKLLFTQHMLTDGWQGYLNKLSLPDTLKLPDTISQPAVSIPDSINFPTTYTLSVPVTDTAHVRDSLIQQYEKLSGTILTIENKIKELESKKAAYEALLQGKRDSLQMLSPLNRTLQSVKKFDVGLCYPDFSPLLASGIVLQGINAEYETKTFYAAAAAGKTLNNLLLTTNAVSNLLHNRTNLFNYFDFGNITSGRNILIVKAGPGTKNGTHLHLGLLLGKGLSSYMIDSNQVLQASSKEINQVLEADARWQVNRNHALQVIYAKSLTADHQKIFNSIETDSIQWLNKNYHSHAAIGKYEGNFPRIKSRLNITVRWVDAFYKSYGVAFARPDNLRFEITTDHQLGKKIKLGTLARQESNNLRGLYSYSIVLYSAGVNISYKPVKAVLLKVQYRPVFLKSENEILTSLQKNKIFTSMATWSPRMNKQRTTFTLVYNDINVSDGATGNHFTFASFTGVIPVHRLWKIQCSSAYYFMRALQPNTVSVIDSAGTSFIHRAECTYSTKKFRLTAGIKAGHTVLARWQWAWNAYVQLPLGIKGLELHAGAEKLLFGDFYNAFSYQAFQRFPYLAHVKINFSW